MSIGASLQGMLRRSFLSSNDKRTASSTIKSSESGERANSGTGLKGLSERLMSQYAETGNQQALSSLYDLHSNKLYYFLLLMSDDQTAQDITQRTWMTVIEKRSTFVNDNNFQAWLFTIGRRALIDEFRRNAKITYSCEAVENHVGDAHSSSVNQSTQLSQHLDKDKFQLAMRQLPFKQRETLSLQLEGFSLEQVSDICHVPKETVKTRLRYARETIKTLMERK